MFLAGLRAPPTMSTYHVLRTKRQREHATMHSDGHQQDKIEGELRRAERWLLLPPNAPGSEKKRDFSPIGQYVRDHIRAPDGSFVPSTAEQFVAHLEHEHRNNSYVGEKTRNGVAGQSQRKCENPLVQIDVNASPPANDYFEVGATVNPSRVAGTVEAIANAMIPQIEGRSGGRVVGWTIHVDSGVIHVVFVVTRLVRDKDGVPRLKVKRGFGLVGPWAVGIDRQRRAGINYPPHDAKFTALLRKFFVRHGDVLPLDIMLARLCDSLCEGLLPGIGAFVTAYRHRVISRRARAIEDKREELRGQLANLGALEDQMKKQVGKQNNPSKGPTRDL